MTRGHRWQAAEGGLHARAVDASRHTRRRARRVFTDDEALTWVRAYWLTGAIGASFAPYAAGGAQDRTRVEIPTVSTVFPKDLVNAPQRFAQRIFDVVDWREFNVGGTSPRGRRRSTTCGGCGAPPPSSRPARPDR